MNLSSRWSIFSKNNKDVGTKVEDEQVEQVSEQHLQNDDEIVFSANSANQEEDQCKQEEERQDDVNIDETLVNEYLKTRTLNNSDDKNSHYKGLHTEVVPTMPVLFIEEFVPPLSHLRSHTSASVTDWRAYVYYDSWRGVYVVNGTRRRSDEWGTGIERKFPDVCMTFKSKSSLAFYLRRSMCSWKHKLSVTMYSMYRSVIHLSTAGAMPSFHSIHHCRNKFRSELFGYDDCHVSLKGFESYLKVLKDCAYDGYLFRPTTTSMV
jgi:hypothetical protein